MYMNKYENIYNLAKILGCNAKYNEPMAVHTTFKIGGGASLFVEVKEPSQLSQLIKNCRRADARYIVIGRGSNLIVNDNGVDLVVFSLTGDFSRTQRLDDNTVYCGAGLSLAGLCRACEGYSLSGLEFAWGIPGSVGGAVYMNAGAYGGEMKDAVYSVTHIDNNGNIGTIRAQDLDFSYRHSVYRDNGYSIIGATFRLKIDNPVEIRNRMDDYMNRRKSKQPLEYPSAGSVFRRPQGNYAGTLIEKCGLKGRAVGGAQVSNKHAGFIINTGGATCSDVRELIKIVQDTVKQQTGYSLEREVIYLD